MATKKYVSLEKLGLYDGKIKKVISDGDAAALASAKEYAEGLGANYDVAGAAATVQGKLDEEVIRAKAREDEVAGLANAAQADVDDLKTYVGTIPGDSTSTDVVGYINEKTSGVVKETAFEELQTMIGVVDGEVTTIKNDYLKGADKTELNDLIAAEADRAKGIEGGLETRLAAVEGDYLKAADKTELQGGIDDNAEAIAAVKEEIDTFLSAAEVGEAAVDTLKEIQEYITSDGEAAANMTANISANASAITAVEGRMDTAEGKIEVAEGKISANETAIADLKAADTALSGRIETLEGQLGEGDDSVADMIAAAKAETLTEAAEAAATKDAETLASANTYTDGEIDKVEATVTALQTTVDGKAANSDLTALAGRVTTAEGEIDTLQTEMDAVEAKAAANETAISTLNTTVSGKAAQTDLDNAIARITAVETWQTNMVECSEEDINSLFA